MSENQITKEYYEVKFEKQNIKFNKREIRIELKLKQNKIKIVIKSELTQYLQYQQYVYL